MAEGVGCDSVNSGCERQRDHGRGEQGKGLGATRGRRSRGGTGVVHA